MNAYSLAWKKYATFTGRAARTEYWVFVLVNFVISLALSRADVMAGLVSDMGFGVLSILFALATLIPSIAVTVRRLHDTGRSGWWFLIGFVPCVGWIVLLVFMVLASQPGSNEYGPNPQGVGA